MDTSRGRAAGLGLTAAALLLAALIAGFMPLSSSGGSCGSALLPRDYTSVGIRDGQAAADGCDSLTSLVAVPVWILLGVGVLLGIAAWVSAINAKDRQREARRLNSAR